MSSISRREFVKDFRPHQRVSGSFAIANAQLGRTKQDKPYLKCLISDRTGSLPARAWSMDPSLFKRLPTDGFVLVEGETQPYQGELQLIIERIEPFEPSLSDLTHLIPSTSKDIEQMFAEVRTILQSLSHPAPRALADAYLEDQALMADFKRCPAAKMMHHAYLGGLLEHTHQLLKIADLICPLYPAVNRDIVILGLFLHDLAKTRELIYDRTFGYTDRGELIGHIVDGAIMLHDKAQQVMLSKGIRLPRNLVMVLQHIILSHHAVPDFGAAKIPSTPEAILVSLIDNLDAKTTIAICASRPEASSRCHEDLGGNFTEKIWALDAKLFRPDPLA